MYRLQIIRVKGDSACVIIFVLSHSDHPNPAEFACGFQSCKNWLHQYYDPLENADTDAEI